MNIKAWKLGLAVSILSGVFTGLIGLGVGMTNRQTIILILINVGKDGLLYLKNTNVSAISFDTTIVKKESPDGTVVTSASRTPSDPQPNKPV